MLFYPLGFYCLYVIFHKTSQVKTSNMVNVVLCLLMLADFMYPTSRLLFYAGCDLNNELPFILSAVLYGIFQITYSLAMWMFAIKIWVLSQNLKCKLYQVNINHQIINLLGIIFNCSNGILASFA